RNFHLPHQLTSNPRNLHPSRYPNHKTPQEIPFIHLRFMPLPPGPLSNDEELPLWSTTPWISKLNSFTKFFSSLQSPNLLLNHPFILYLSTNAGHEVMALQNMGFIDWIRVSVVHPSPELIQVKEGGGESERITSRRKGDSTRKAVVCR
ncbi:unnamed protein product, partial [Linum tenue]